MKIQLLKSLTRLVLIDGQLKHQVYLSDEILSIESNKNVTLKEGWHTFNDNDCMGDHPKDPLGPPGAWLCVSGQWVWIPT